MKKWSILLLLLLSSGCSLSKILRVEGSEALPDDSVEQTVSIVAKDLGEHREFFDGLIARFTREPSRLGDGVMGWTQSPWTVWVRVTDQRHDVCKTVLVHELLHVYLWRKTGDPDAAHATHGIWDLKNSATSPYEAELSTEARLFKHVCVEMSR